MAHLINVTPHEVNMISSEGVEYLLPTSGTVLHARFVDEAAGAHPSGAELVRTRIEADPTSLAALLKLESENPGALMVGSLIAAQAFPGRVMAMIAAPGFERKAPAEKRMRDDKFTTF